MEKTIQKYLIEFKMAITPNTIKLVKENYEIIYKRNYEYGLTEDSENDVNNTLVYIKQNDLKIKLLEGSIIRHNKLLNSIIEDNPFFWFSKNKNLKLKQNYEYNIQDYKEKITSIKEINSLLLEKIELIKKDNKFNFDIRNAVLMAKDNLK